MYTLGRQQGRRQVNIWPGFVDALATLLLVIIFVLMVFMVAQFFLSVALSGKDQALERLQGEINELAELLSLERSANSDLRINVADLSSQLQDSLAAQDSLTGQLRAIMSERDDLTARLGSAEAEAARSREAAARDRAALAEEQARTQSSRDRLEEAIAALRVDKDRLKAALAAIASQKTDLEDAFKTIEANKATIEAQIAELAILKSLRDEMVAELTAAEAAIAQRDKDLSDSKAALSAEQDSRAALEAQLSSVRGALGEQEELAAESQAQVAILNRQIFALRQQLARISVLLDAADAANAEQQVMIKNLGQRLNIALASKVQELARYRSEFFGRLREILGDRQDIRIVGDRFVFQSEVLFESGSADLGGEGRLQLSQLAGALREIAATIPENINWILQVDGHTDRAPISTYAFPSNWELSTARAISVVKFLVSQGIAPERLAATGFGEFQPLDPGSDLQAFRRNRRIELKLTQR